MPTVVHAAKRLTFRYRPNWAHLDQWDRTNPVVIKVLPGKVFDPYERDRRRGKRSDDHDPSDAGISAFNVVVKHPKRLRTEQVRQALIDNVETGGCDHDHDCCGCASASVTTVLRKGRREWYVEMSHSRNL